MAKRNREYVCVCLYMCVHKFSAFLIPVQYFLLVINDFSIWFVLITISTYASLLPPQIRKQHKNNQSFRETH